MKMKSVLFRLICGSALIIFMLFAVSCTSTPAQVNAGADGIAIKGFDPVAYFAEGKPGKGENEFTYEWNGAKWLFSSRQHLDLFVAAPDKYAPQYGGY